MKHENQILESIFKARKIVKYDLGLERYFKKDKKRPHALFSY